MRNTGLRGRVTNALAARTSTPSLFAAPRCSVSTLPPLFFHSCSHSHTHFEPPPRMDLDVLIQEKLQAAARGGGSGGVLPDELATLLATAYENDGILDRALEALDSGAVTRLEAAPSGRALFTVRASFVPPPSPAACKPGGEAAAAAPQQPQQLAALSTARRSGMLEETLLLEDGGCGDGTVSLRPALSAPSSFPGRPLPTHFYLVLPGFCTCWDFADRVLGGGRGGSSSGAGGGIRRHCKHSLAVALGEALGRFKRRPVSDAAAARVLAAAAASGPFPLLPLGGGDAAAAAPARGPTA